MRSSHPTVRRRPRRGRTISKLAAVTLVAGIGVLAVSTPAFADSPSDPRATYYTGDVHSCAAVGFPGDTQVGTYGLKAADKYVAGVVYPNFGSIQPGHGQEVDVAIRSGAPSNLVVDAVVTVGAYSYNVYHNQKYLPPALKAPQHYITPFDDKGYVPMVWHWFICYHLGNQIPVGTIGGVGLAAIAGLGLVVWQRRRRHLGELPAAT